MLKKLLLPGAFLIPFLFSAQETSKQPKISIIPAVGFGWRTAELPSGLTNDEKNYIKDLKKGFNFDIGAYYHLNGPVAIGVKYSNYSASSNGRISVVNNSGNVVSAAVSTKDNITFFGPGFLISNYNEPSRHKLFLDLALGVITYTTKTGSVKGTGSNLGAEIDFAYQYQISRNFLIGPKLGLTGGTLSKMKYNGVTYNFDEDQKEGLSRVSLSAAATFRF
ncbi:hypothetical protein N0B16_12645 [Chryseobacterium sp. GMJ5]|uniref:Outer membrane protein beta-barrel domain-containing protein n=1 Tax=Chryseobacterium gilvum TaxID=2976534 RepID=A0ABT2W1V2_9FLAO|nr:hypothetical protein [Chryseobacterium gilvum]MCU7615289.1 hypothetical protein [Chryseobacterium gilvum]